MAFSFIFPPLLTLFPTLMQTWEDDLLHVDLHPWIVFSKETTSFHGFPNNKDLSCGPTKKPKYRGIANAITETSWVRYLLVNCVAPKHIEIDIHFVCDKFARGHICVFHVPSSQYEDIFTKRTIFTDFHSSFKYLCSFFC